MIQLPKNITRQKGFTLIELLVVIGILAILLAITLIAINPARQFGNANNTKRRSDVTQVLNATGQYIAENRGQLPSEIANLAIGTAFSLNHANFPTLCGLLTPTYIPALPTNPSLNKNDITIADCTAASATWDTGYFITKDPTNRITISAEGLTDNGATIQVTR